MSNYHQKIEYLNFLLHVAELRLSKEPNSNFYKHEVATIKGLMEVVNKCDQLTEENKQLKEKWQKWKRLAQDFDKSSREEEE